jgi:hypothetical protein
MEQFWTEKRVNNRNVDSSIGGAPAGKVESETGGETCFG